MKFLNLDSPLMRALSKMADLMWLNILTILCCIPIVTAGASFTAMHFVLLKIVRDEEGYITKDFFRSFKENFGQATVIWILSVLVGGLIIWDLWYVLFSGAMEDVNTVYFAALCVSGILFLIIFTFVFPVLSHFVNSIGKTIKNAFYMGILVLPKTVLMIVLYLVPAAVIYFVTALIPLAVLFCFTGPGYASALLYNKTFKRFEPAAEEVVSDMEWTLGAADEPSAEDASEAEDTQEADTDEKTGETSGADLSEESN